MALRNIIIDHIQVALNCQPPTSSLVNISFH